jgi:hypothetical protein
MQLENNKRKLQIDCSMGMEPSYNERNHIPAMNTTFNFSPPYKKYLVNCDKCNHDFSALKRDITTLHTSWCPYCAGRINCDTKD